MMLRMYRKLFVKSWIGMMVLSLGMPAWAGQRGSSNVSSVGVTDKYPSCDNGNQCNKDEVCEIISINEISLTGTCRRKAATTTGATTEAAKDKITLDLYPTSQQVSNLGNTPTSKDTQKAPVTPQYSTTSTPPSTPAAPTTPSGGPGYIEERSRVRLTGDDECEYSATFDGGWKCDFTKNLVTGAQVSHQVTQFAGSAVVQVAGQNEAAKAAQSGKMSDSYDAGAKITERTAQIQLATGVINLGLGAALAYKGFEHNNKAKKAKQAMNQAEAANLQVNSLTGEVSTGGAPAAARTAATAAPSGGSDGMVQEMIQNYKINSVEGPNQFTHGRFTVNLASPDPATQGVAQQALDARRRHAARLLQDAAQNIAKEQSSTGSAATAQGIQSLVTGAGQMIMGMSYKSMADQMKKAANQIKDIEGMNAALPGGPGTMPQLPPGNGGLPFTPPGAIAPPAIIGKEDPTTDGKDSFAETGSKKSLDEKPLPGGRPKDEFTGVQLPDKPLPMGGGGVGGGNPLNVAGGGLQGLDQGGNGEAGSEGKLPNEADPRYVGGAGGGAYGVGGRGGGGADGGPDLSKLLDKLTAKDENFAQKPNIEEFGRDPASEPYSFLDKSVDIFQRVHQAYQAKARAGRVVLF